MATLWTRVRLIWQNGEPGSTKSCKLDFMEDGAPPSLATLDAVAEAVLESARTGAHNWDEIAAAGYDLLAVGAQNMEFVDVVPPDPDKYPYDRRESPTTIERLSVGASVPASISTPLPPATCQLVKLVTATPGQSYRGRVYLPGGAEADASAAGLISAADAAANGDFIHQLTDAAVGAFTLAAPVVVSIALDVATEIVDWVGITSLATQRRRQKYVRA